MIEILGTPPLNTVQDAGTDEARRYGFGPAGALDPVALRLANALVGNAEGAACLEVQMFPLVARFTADTCFAVAGSASVRLDEVALPSCWAGSAAAGQRLRIDRGEDGGARAYLGIAGGIEVPEVLGSRSTRAKGFGGFEGRHLRKGDVLPAGAARRAFLRPGGFGVVPPRAALASAGTAEDGALCIRVLRAGEYEQLDADSRQHLWRGSFAVSSRSNRQGCRLEGPPLRRTTAANMRSQPLVPGVMQLTPQGTLIVLMNDTNAAGGYPRVGTVVDADLWRLAQAAPGQALRFVDCSYEDAVAATVELREYLRKVRDAAELWSLA